MTISFSRTQRPDPTKCRAGKHAWIEHNIRRDPTARCARCHDDAHNERRRSIGARFDEQVVYLLAAGHCHVTPRPIERWIAFQQIWAMEDAEVARRLGCTKRQVQRYRARLRKEKTRDQVCD